MHYNLYEINTRVWLRRFGEQATLDDVPDSYWQFLAEQGMDYIWLMGIWKTVAEATQRYAFSEDLIREYRASLNAWQPKDVIGSPYAIDCYEPDVMVGNWDQLARLRKKLKKLGMRLILDFVPNHFNAESSLIKKHPAVFLNGSEKDLVTQSDTYYRPLGNNQIFAHGKDPNFAAWTDTIQVNYNHPEARAFMRQQIARLADVCDGIRCDMAMLPLNSVFARTWPQHQAQGTQEFWPQAINEIKETNPDFLFIAEAYWDLEWELQQQGFDYTYDKRLLDRLKEAHPIPIRDHLRADLDFQSRSVRFLENHDEERILSRFHSKQAEAMALITYTIPGMRFFNWGQWEGRRIRLPVQLGREPEETGCFCGVSSDVMPGPMDFATRPLCRCTYAFYQRLLNILKQPILRQGNWTSISIANTPESLFAWRWSLGKEHRIVLVNYSNMVNAGKLDLTAFTSKTIMDVLSQQSWPFTNHFSFRLYPWQGVILKLE
ncbi:MAG: alpha-amylase [Saprospiraceae bacterium]|nr:MAG: alpha-amylase [Saprospiraceae bacterium]